MTEQKRGIPLTGIHIDTVERSITFQSDQSATKLTLTPDGIRYELLAVSPAITKRSEANMTEMSIPVTERMKVYVEEGKLGNRGRRETPPVFPAEGEIPLGAKLRARRWYQVITLKDIAQLAGDYKPNTISQIEIGRESPSLFLLERLSNVLGFDSVDELVNAPRAQVLEWAEIGGQRMSEARRRRGDVKD